MKQENPIEILNKYKKLVYPRLFKYLKDPTYPKAFQIPPKYNKQADIHWDTVRDYPQRQGKYLRPTLLILTAKAMGADINKALLPACGMQISEDWLLIHDDWEDDSLARRGKPALHRIYSPELAVNAGDALHVIMWKIFSDTDKVLGTKKREMIINEFYTQLMRTTLGQSAEIQWMQGKVKKFTDQDWYFIADGKTSYYTIACPMRLGAIVADASQSQLKALSEFGLILGRCFQLVDDILDLTSDFAGLKGPLGNDILEGKKTLILGHLQRKAKGNDLKTLEAILTKPRHKRTQKDVKTVLTLMEKYKSIEYSRKIASKLKDEALFLFESKLKFLKEDKARKELKTLIHFVLERDH